MEYWDVIDKSGWKTGKTIQRGGVLAPGEYHLVVHVWIKNKDNNFLIQKRAAHLEWAPGMWATTGGSAIQGEDSFTAVTRETNEELGIQLSPGKLRLLASIVRRDSITDVWMAETSATAEQCILEEAVTAVKYVSMHDLFAMHNNGEFVDYRNGEQYSPELYMQIFETGF